MPCSNSRSCVREWMILKCRDPTAPPPRRSLVTRKILRPDARSWKRNCR